MDVSYALMGGGGLALELFEYMNSEGEKLIGYYAPEEDLVLSRYLRWLGNERNTDLNPSVHYVIASGLLAIRQKIIAFLEGHYLTIGSFISKYAYVSSLAVLGKGVVVVPGVAITGNAVLGDYVLINLHSVIAHDACVGNNVVVGPGVMITGHCKIEDNVIFGTNSALLPGTVVGANSEIGILTFPRKRVRNNTTVITSPGTVFS